MGIAPVIAGRGGSAISPAGNIPRIATPDPAFVVTSFQSGHGWTSSGSGVATLNDTAAFVRGSQSLKGVTDGAGGGFAVRRTGLPALNITGKIPVVVFRVDDWTNLSDVSLYIGDTAFANRWVLTYTDSLASLANQDSMLIRDGEWGVLTLPWGVKMSTTGSPTRSAVTDFQLRAADKNGVPITVHFQSLYFIPEQSVFANGVVSLVFDDGWDSQYTQARLKMDQYGFPGTAYVIAQQQISAVNGYMTLQQLHDLEALNGWQISAHSYSNTFHNNWATATPASSAVESDILNMKSWMTSEGFKGSDHFAYPGGMFNSSVEKTVSTYFSSARTLNASCHESLAPWKAHRLRTGVYVTDATATATITAEIDKAFTNKTWLIIVFHKIVTTPAASTEYSIANFGTVIDYLNTKTIPVRTVEQVLRSVPGYGS